jgi:hypothetical protein
VKSGFRAITPPPPEDDHFLHRQQHAKGTEMVTKAPRKMNRFTYAATLVGAAAALLITAPLASALPDNGSGPTAGEWDIGAYDSCMSKIPTIPPGPHGYDQAHFNCCKDSGGVYTWPNGTQSPGTCSAPPAQNTGSDSQSGGKPRPGRLPAGTVLEQVEVSS